MTNAVAGVPSGTGVILSGVVGQAVGGPTSALGNTISGSEIGLLMGPCASAACTAKNGGNPIATTGNLVQDNSSTNNTAFGVLLVGGFQPQEFGAPVSSNAASTGNTFDSNTWTGNGTGQPTKVHGANILDGSGWGGKCLQLNVCTTAVLVYDGSNATFSTGISTLTLSVHSTSGDPLAPGSAMVVAGWDATFFVTTTVIVGPFSTKLSLQAVAPGMVPAFNLAMGTTLTVNGPALAGGNSFGSGVNVNSCTPDGYNAVPNVFGTGGPTWLNSGTGGVNATYLAC
jgi:hypothetical protein